MAGPLSGVRIVELASVIMGPFASQILSDHGADVIKIEPPGGDVLRNIGPTRNPGMSANFLHANRGKRSIMLDLKQAEDSEVARKLIAQADVFLFNFRPGSIARLGLSYETISAINPRIIFCGAYGFGEDGPYAGKPAYDDLIQALVAIPMLEAQSTGTIPRFTPVPLADRMVGLAAVYSVAMALFARERTGKGQQIEVPMFENMAYSVLSDHLWGQTFEPPIGAAVYERQVLRRPYKTKDGYICAMVYNDSNWKRFAEFIGQPEILQNPKFRDIKSRTDNIAEVYLFLDTILSQRTVAEWLEILSGLDIPAMPIHSVASMGDDPHLKAVGFLTEVEHPSEGTVKSMKSPNTWSGTPLSHGLHAPRLGEHTAEVLSELGYGAEQVEAFLARRGQPAPRAKAAA